MKYMMGAPVKMVNIMASKSYEGEEETKKLNEEIRYLEKNLDAPTPPIKG